MTPEYIRGFKDAQIAAAKLAENYGVDYALEFGRIAHQDVVDTAYSISDAISEMKMEESK